MQNLTSNVCIRCGKQRIVAKTWKESTKGGVITHTTTTCPNPDCQKIIDQQFAVQKEKRETIEEERQKRILASRIARRRTI